MSTYLISLLSKCSGGKGRGIHPVLSAMLYLYCSVSTFHPLVAVLNSLKLKNKTGSVLFSLF